MKSFFLFPNEYKDRDLAVTKAVAEKILSCGGSVSVLAKYAARMPVGVTAAEATDLPPDTDAIISIGGDGTVLAASETALLFDLPLFGVNLGRRGYLTALEPSELDRLSVLLTDGCYTRELMALRVCHVKGGEAHTFSHLSVNDVVFHRSVTGNTVGLSFGYEGESAISYIGDGLILSTPTGSTAYSLSAGGPVLSSDVRGICATPICPHSFFDRPVIFGADKRITVSNSSALDAVNVSLDGKEHFLLAPGDRVCVEISKKPLRVLTTEPYDFIGTLCKKMKVTE